MSELVGISSGTQTLLAYLLELSNGNRVRQTPCKMSPPRPLRSKSLALVSLLPNSVFRYCHLHKRFTKTGQFGAAICMQAKLWVHWGPWPNPLRDEGLHHAKVVGCEGCGLAGKALAQS